MQCQKGRQGPGEPTGCAEPRPRWLSTANRDLRERGPGSPGRQVDGRRRKTGSEKLVRDKGRRVVRGETGGRRRLPRRPADRASARGSPNRGPTERPGDSGRSGAWGLPWRLVERRKRGMGGWRVEQGASPNKQNKGIRAPGLEHRVRARGDDGGTGLARSRMHRRKRCCSRAGCSATRAGPAGAP